MYGKKANVGKYVKVRWPECLIQAGAYSQVNLKRRRRPAWFDMPMS